MPEVKPALRTLLRQALPFRAFLFVRFCWFLSLYFPRLVNSWFVKRTPEVRGLGGGGGASHLVKQLRSVNALAPKRLGIIWS
jgi:hypothetical protein